MFTYTITIVLENLSGYINTCANKYNQKDHRLSIQIFSFHIIVANTIYEKVNVYNDLRL